MAEKSNYEWGSATMRGGLNCNYNFNLRILLTKPPAALTSWNALRRPRGEYP